MTWQRQGGPKAIKALESLGLTPAEDDLPPPLQWEAPVWSLYIQLQYQWDVGMHGRTGLRLQVFIDRMKDKGWDVERGLELLSAIERAWLIDMDSDD